MRSGEARHGSCCAEGLLQAGQGVVKAVWSALAASEPHHCAEVAKSLSYDLTVSSFFVSKSFLFDIESIESILYKFL